LEILMQIVADHGDQIDQQWTEKMDEVRQLTTIDPLTRISNRRGLDEYYGAVWQRMGEARGLLALILADIDYFKGYNDYYGHLAGDQCLIQVVRAMEEALGQHPGLLARNGGEEFAVVLPGLDIAAAAEIAELLRQKVAALHIPHSTSATAPYVTISLGVASLTPHPDNQPESLFREADQLLYQAKREGRNRVARPAFREIFSTLSLGNSVINQIFGSYYEEASTCQEFLKLVFSPSSLPIKQRWRNNDLSADFLADYFSTFFPALDDDPSLLQRQSEIKSAISYIANELLENAMKYCGGNTEEYINLQLQLHGDYVLFVTSNGVDASQAERLQASIRELLESDPNDLLIQRLEASAQQEEVSGVGFLTMLTDYSAELGWKFEIPVTTPGIGRVTTTVRLTV
jgi:diguanylate cyclase (GGDEF)-like protein